MRLRDIVRQPKPSIDKRELHQHLVRLRGCPERLPDASIIVPVNAQGDLENVLYLLTDIARYDGGQALEVILVINNYTPENPPLEIEAYGALGAKVIGVPDVRRFGEAVGLSARIHGLRAAASDYAILFDADCRIPNATEIIDWYVAKFRSGYQVAYTLVGYYDFDDCRSIRARIFIHHLSRWAKRNLLRIPTTRGSNYAVNGPSMLRLYEDGMLADEMNVGPNFRAVGAKIAYSGSRELQVLTSGRMFFRGWFRLPRYIYNRLHYNMRTLPVRKNVHEHTGRKNYPVRRYLNNKPIRH